MGGDGHRLGAGFISDGRRLTGHASPHACACERTPLVGDGDAPLAHSRLPCPAPISGRAVPGSGKKHRNLLEFCELLGKG